MKILIVDDDPISRTVLRRILEKNLQGEVTEAENGLIAWNMLRAGASPDLLMLDVMMPELNGIDLLARIRAHEQLNQQKVIICTALSSQSTMDELSSLGVEGYMVKPFATRVVLEQVRKAMARSEEGAASDRGSAASGGAGAEANDYTRSLLRLTEDVRNGISSVRLALPAGDFSGASATMETLRQACLKMGAAALVAQAEGLGRLLQELAGANEGARGKQDYVVRPLSALLDQMEEENVKLSSRLLARPRGGKRNG